MTTTPTSPGVPTTISNLPAAGNVTLSDYIPIVQSGVTYRATASQLAAVVQANSIAGANGVTASTVAGVTTVSGVTATTSQIGVVKPDGTTITISGGVISATGVVLTVGTTAISGGTNGRILYDNGGVLGELATTGSGNVVLASSPTIASPTLTTPVLGVASATSINFGGTTLSTYQTGTWTPVDGSGASLSLTVGSASYTKIGRIVLIELNVTYPNTANGSSANIGGLPFTSAGNVYVAPAMSSYTTSVIAATINGGVTAITFNTANGTVAITNANLSQKQTFVTIMYEATTN